MMSVSIFRNLLISVLLELSYSAKGRPITKYELEAIEKIFWNQLDDTLKNFRFSSVLQTKELHLNFCKACLANETIDNSSYPDKTGFCVSKIYTSANILVGPNNGKWSPVELDSYHCAQVVPSGAIRLRRYVKSVKPGCVLAVWKTKDMYDGKDVHKIHHQTCDLDSYLNDRAEELERIETNFWATVDDNLKNFRFVSVLFTHGLHFDFCEVCLANETIDDDSYPDKTGFCVSEIYTSAKILVGPNNGKWSPVELDSYHCAQVVPGGAIRLRRYVKSVKPGCVLAVWKTKDMYDGNKVHKFHHQTCGLDSYLNEPENERERIEISFWNMVGPAVINFSFSRILHDMEMHKQFCKECLASERLNSDSYPDAAGFPVSKIYTSAKILVLPQNNVGPPVEFDSDHCGEEQPDGTYRLRRYIKSVNLGCVLGVYKTNAMKEGKEVYKIHHQTCGQKQFLGE